MSLIVLRLIAFLFLVLLLFFLRLFFFRLIRLVGLLLFLGRGGPFDAF